MRRSLRLYQLPYFAYALNWEHPALLVEMRLGKNIVTIRRCNLYKPRGMGGLRVLIVAPNSALDSWEEELNAECEQDSHVRLQGTRKQRLSRLHERWKWNLINKEGFLALPEIADVEWDAVVMDESTTIRNPGAKVTKFFLKNFREVPHRWILSGTPNPENDLEYYCQFAFLDGQFMGFKNYWDFRFHLFKQWGFDWVPRKGTAKKLQSWVGRRAYLLRRKDVKMEPEKVKQTRGLELPPEFRKRYDAIEADFATGDITTKWATVRHLWLWRAAGGFFDVDNPIPTWHGKAQELLSIVKEEMPKDPLVVSFRFLDELHYCFMLLGSAKVSCGILTGAIPPVKRTETLKFWRQGVFRVLLVQEQVVQMGTNLAHSDCMIFYSRTPSGLLQAQIEDRILDVTKKTLLLYIYLVLKGTVDEDLHLELKAKRLRSGLSFEHSMQERMLHRLGK